MRHVIKTNLGLRINEGIAMLGGDTSNDEEQNKVFCNRVYHSLCFFNDILLDIL